MGEEQVRILVEKQTFHMLKADFYPYYYQTITILIIISPLSL